MPAIFGAARSRRSGLKGQHSRSVEGFNHDGVELARLRGHERGLPIRQVLLFVLAVIAFKVFLFLELGAVGYGAKVEQLRRGNLFEQVAGVVMELDPASQWVVGRIRDRAW